MYETLYTLLHRQPFRTFEILLSNGSSHKVKHPEMAVLLKTKIILGVPESGLIITCFLLHVAEVRSIEEVSE